MATERKIYQDLVAWKNGADRKLLILQGARQVGKTYIVNYFAGKEYSISIYCNFEKDKGFHDFFKDMTPASIIKKIALYKRKEVFPQNTLIIFDETQACPEAVTSLKYFREEANQYQIIAPDYVPGEDHTIEKPDEYETFRSHYETICGIYEEPENLTQYTWPNGLFARGVELAWSQMTFARTYFTERRYNMNWCFGDSRRLSPVLR